ncbi:Small metal-binding protein [Methylomagnum ishizawai]|uniref:Small metal-binding protein n=1 Tax=Methylomagnum ishizawai TaxID=1760988 RepID=A0A1Y6D1Q7_9GAMM|nr:small metal-binding protein SmbP [Methylomagnum ishizawai]SMF96868.1 Small metal-binding protein [Methylomagnum ishizawai]
MRTRTTRYLAVLCVALGWGVQPAWAGDHMDAALKHTEAAADAQDSDTVVQHTESALREIKAAVAEKEIPKEKAHAVIDALEDLQAADKSAHSHNTRSAIEQANDAKADLEKVIGK